MNDEDFSMETSSAWKLLPSWVLELWIAWILVAFFVIRVIGSQAAHHLFAWYRHLK